MPAVDRKQAVTVLREQGLSQRAIAAVTGVSPQTVSNDLADQVSNSGHLPITGIDGKRYPSGPKREPKPSLIC